MGWFWSSKTPGEASSSSSSPSSSPSSPPPPPPPPSQSIQPHPTDSPASSSPQTTEDSASHDGDPELHKFMAMLQGSDNGSSGSSGNSVTNAASSPPPAAAKAPSKLAAAWKAAWPASSTQDTTKSPKDAYVPRERSLAEAVLPVDMSCRQAFDLAWACQSPAGQWRAVYRNGSVQQCSALWDDFWFCMRVKGYGEGKLKDDAVREHYRRKEMDKYYRHDTPSSEDVWQARTVDEVLPPGAVFQNSFAAVLKRAEAAPATMATTAAAASVDDGRDDANKILADAERRRRIREEMGYTS